MANEPTTAATAFSGCPRPGPVGEPYVVKSSVTGCVRVRADHNVTATEVGCLTAGTPMTASDTFPYWREVTFGTQEGWIAKKFIEPATPPPVSTSTTIPADAILEVHFVDVGQGDAIWIQTHDDGIDGNGRFEGLSIVIDGGPYSRDIDNPFREYVESIGHHGAEIEAMICYAPAYGSLQGC